jgi:hypothetical protein
MFVVVFRCSKFFRNLHSRLFFLLSFAWCWTSSCKSFFLPSSRSRKRSEIEFNRISHCGYELNMSLSQGPVEEAIPVPHVCPECWCEVTFGDEWQVLDCGHLYHLTCAQYRMKREYTAPDPPTTENAGPAQIGSADHELITCGACKKKVRSRKVFISLTPSEPTAIQKKRMNIFHTVQRLQREELDRVQTLQKTSIQLKRQLQECAHWHSEREQLQQHATELATSISGDAQGRALVALCLGNAGGTSYNPIGVDSLQLSTSTSLSTIQLRNSIESLSRDEEIWNHLTIITERERDTKDRVEKLREELRKAKEEAERLRKHRSVVRQLLDIPSTPARPSPQEQLHVEATNSLPAANPVQGNSPLQPGNDVCLTQRAGDLNRKRPRVEPALSQSQHAEVIDVDAESIADDDSVVLVDEKGQPLRSKKRKGNRNRPPTGSPLGRQVAPPPPMVRGEETDPSAPMELDFGRQREIQRSKAHNHFQIKRDHHISTRDLPRPAEARFQVGLPDLL